MLRDATDASVSLRATCGRYGQIKEWTKQTRGRSDLSDHHGKSADNFTGYAGAFPWRAVEGGTPRISRLTSTLYNDSQRGRCVRRGMSWRAAPPASSRGSRCESPLFHAARTASAERGRLARRQPRASPRRHWPRDRRATEAEQRRPHAEREPFVQGTRALRELLAQGEGGAGLVLPHACPSVGMAHADNERRQLQP